MQVETGALPCDAFHHFYHYQSSTQYLWLARVCFALVKKEEAVAALEKALFQDHYNDEALQMKRHGSGEDIKAKYQKHPLLDAEFRAYIGHTPNTATHLHDEAVERWLASDDERAINAFQSAIANSPAHSNSYLGLAKCLLRQGKYEEAYVNVQEAIRLSHCDHTAYHHSAAQAHIARGKEFLALQEYDLAMNDFDKALDLCGWAK